MKEGHLKYSRLSWEPEMFISGGLVYTLFQIPKLLSQIKVYVEPLGGFPGLNEMLVTIAYGFAVLTVGFILHLTIKTVWVGMNAYNYAHGNLLHTERFKILDKFSKHNSTDLNDHILKVNQIAGLFFGTSVFLLMSFLGLVIYFVVVMTIGWVIDAPGLYYNSTIVPILIYLFDNLTFGLLRKNRYGKSVV